MNSWDQRYSAPGLVYGEQPNRFVREQAWRLAGKRVIELGAGEGRNAVFLARQGLDVTAVDFSEVGIRKALELAERNETALRTILADVTAWHPDATWGGVVVTFLHLPPTHRPTLYRLIHRLLEPGGILVAEWFRPEQRLLGYTSGGPPTPDLMVSLDELAGWFEAAGLLMAEETITDLDEGNLHKGEAAVVRLVWRKPP